MKIILFSGYTYCIPLLQHLSAAGSLQAVVSVDEINRHNQQLEQIAALADVSFLRFSKQDLNTKLAAWLEEQAADLVIVYNFRWKLPASVLSIPRFGFINVHYSMLPAYRGGDPVFWQIKEGVMAGGVTLHQLTEDLDAGPLLVQQALERIPGENSGIYASRLGQLSLNLIHNLLQHPDITLSAVQNQNEQDAFSRPAVGANDLVIDWDRQSAAEVENLVNACNPNYDGAITFFRGQQIRILEVTPATAPEKSNQPGGTIALAHPDQGVFVSCSDGAYLRINVVSTAEGILSGFKLAALGVQAGDRMFSPLATENQQTPYSFKNI